MCTASWIKNDDGYELFFNRDEAHTRKIAQAPTIKTAAGVSYISPVDTDAGGTWIGVNNFGITICLLNFYKLSGKEPAREYTSRGYVLNALIDCASREDVLERISADWLSEFRSFTLLILDPAYPMVAVTWNKPEGQIYIEEDIRSPVSSSSKNSSDVVNYRTGLFSEMSKGIETIDTEFLSTFHRSHIPKESEYSICMHRDDASSVSLSRISVKKDNIRFFYASGAPCNTAFQAPVEFARNYVNAGRIEQHIKEALSINDDASS